mgnify:CR=1 FL=1
MFPLIKRRRFLQTMGASLAAAPLVSGGYASAAKKAEWDASIKRGLDWAAQTQSRLGHWAGGSGQYPTAMTALAGTAFSHPQAHLQHHPQDEGACRLSPPTASVSLLKSYF